MGSNLSVGERVLIGSMPFDFKSSRSEDDQQICFEQFWGDLGMETVFYGNALPSFQSKFE